MCMARECQYVPYRPPPPEQAASAACWLAPHADICWRILHLQGASHTCTCMQQPASDAASLAWQSAPQLQSCTLWYGPGDLNPCLSGSCRALHCVAQQAVAANSMRAASLGEVAPSPALPGSLPAAWLQAGGTAGHLPLPLANAMVSEREDPVAGHPRYQKIKDLNEGTFGFVQLGFDKKTNAQVGLSLSCSGDGPNYAVGTAANSLT